MCVCVCACVRVCVRWCILMWPTKSPDVAYKSPYGAYLLILRSRPQEEAVFWYARNVRGP